MIGRRELATAAPPPHDPRRHQKMAALEFLFNLVLAADFTQRVSKV